MYVVDALNKSQPYAFPYLPPFVGQAHAPALPGPDGHFDYFEVGTREFNAAHMYGTLRFVLDIWENYFDRKIEWHFSEHLARLELIPHLDWNNAQSGYGFIETGFGFDEDYGEHPFCLNFDILSHELGHSFIFAVVGTPPAERVSTEYLAFQEAASDIITLLSTLHFQSVVDHVLAETRGNIYVRNELNRFAELSPTHQIRDAGNSLVMADVPDLGTPAERLSQPDIHLIGQPLTGAVFDILVELFQSNLVQRDLISDELNALSRRAEERDVAENEEALIQQYFDAAFQHRAEAFAYALMDARDIVGRLCAATFTQLRPDLTFPQFYEAFLQADREVFNGEFADLIRRSFEWRGIFVAARVPKASARHGFMRRSIVSRKSRHSA